MGFSVWISVHGIAVWCGVLLCIAKQCEHLPDQMRLTDSATERVKKTMKGGRNASSSNSATCNAHDAHHTPAV